MQGPNIQQISPSMSHGHPPPPPTHNMSPPPNVTQSMQQGMPLVHTSQAEHMHGYHRGEMPVERNGDPGGMGGGGGGGGNGGGVGVIDIQLNPGASAGKKDKGTKEKGYVG